MGLVDELVDVHEGEVGSEVLRDLLQRDEAVRGGGGGEVGVAARGAEDVGLLQHLAHAEHAQEIRGGLPSGEGISLIAAAYEHGGGGGVVAAELERDDGLAGLLRQRKQTEVDAARGGDDVNVHLGGIIGQGVNEPVGEVELLIELEALHGKDVQIGRIKRIRERVGEGLEGDLSGHAVVVLGELVAASEAAGTLEHILMINHAEDGLNVQLHIDSAGDGHNKMSPFKFCAFSIQDRAAKVIVRLQKLPRCSCKSAKHSKKKGYARFCRFFRDFCYASPSCSRCASSSSRRWKARSRLSRTQ